MGSVGTGSALPIRLSLSLLFLGVSIKWTRFFRMPLVEENSAVVANKVQKKDAFGKVRLGAWCIGMASLKPN